jgi:hypothetical protein
MRSNLPVKQSLVEQLKKRDGGELFEIENVIRVENLN